MSFYYNTDKVFSYPALINLIIGGRGIGKTFNFKLAVIKRFLKTGEQFVYVRRYKTELDSALPSFFSALQAKGYFEEHDLRVKKSKMLTEFICDGKVCGYAVALSTSNILKSAEFPNVKTIIYDEFILDPQAGSYRYLRSEVKVFLDLIETIFRMRDDGKVFMLGNNEQFYGCPFVAFWNLELPYESEFKTFKNGTILVNLVKNNDEFIAAKSKTRFATITEGTLYSDYAIHNKSYRENDQFIAKRPSNNRFYCILVINGENLGVWQGIDGYVYISDKYDPNSPYKFACDFDDHTEKTIFLSFRENYCLKYCIGAYKQGWCRFENMRVKSIAQGLFNKCLSI